jgi:hypothetical protein
MEFRVTQRLAFYNGVEIPVGTVANLPEPEVPRFLVNKGVEEEIEFVALSLEVVSQDWLNVVFRMAGGVPPYTFNIGRDADVSVEPGENAVVYPNMGDFTARLTDSTGEEVVLDLLVRPEIPTTWTPASLDNLPAINGLARVAAFEQFVFFGEPPNGSLRALLTVNSQEFVVPYDENGRPVHGSSSQRWVGMPLTPGVATRVFVALPNAREVFGFEITGPEDFVPGEFRPLEAFRLPNDVGVPDRVQLLDEAQGSAHTLFALVSFLNVIGGVNQTENPWPQGRGVSIWRAAGGTGQGHWNGTEWLEGVAPAPSEETPPPEEGES